MPGIIDCELDLLDRLNNSPFVKRLGVTVDTLEEADGAEIVKRIGANAPAIFVVADPFNIQGDVMTLPFVLFIVTKNAKGTKEARQGDGIAAGLYHLMVMTAALFSGSNSVGAKRCAWVPTRGSYIIDQQLKENGLAAGAIYVQTKQALPEAELLEEMWVPFLRFHADYDVAPGETDAARAKWLETPPDHSETKPDADGDTALTQTT